MELLTDASGGPGAVLGSWFITAPPAPYAQVGSPTSVDVEANSQYWIVLLPGADDTALAWAWNNLGIESSIAYTHDGTTFAQDSSTTVAFDVEGTPVPEPATFALGGLVLAWFAWARARNTPVSSSAR